MFASAYFTTWRMFSEEGGRLRSTPSNCGETLTAVSGLLDFTRFTRDCYEWRS